MALLTLSQLPSILQWMDGILARRGPLAAMTIDAALLGSYFFQFDRSISPLFLQLWVPPPMLGISVDFAVVLFELNQHSAKSI